MCVCVCVCVRTERTHTHTHIHTHTHVEGFRAPMPTRLSSETHILQQDQRHTRHCLRTRLRSANANASGHRGWSGVGGSQSAHIRVRAAPTLPWRSPSASCSLPPSAAIPCRPVVLTRAIPPAPPRAARALAPWRPARPTRPVRGPLSAPICAPTVVAWRGSPPHQLAVTVTIPGPFALGPLRLLSNDAAPAPRVAPSARLRPCAAIVSVLPPRRYKLSLPRTCVCIAHPSVLQPRTTVVCTSAFPAPLPASRPLTRFSPLRTTGKRVLWSHRRACSHMRSSSHRPLVESACWLTSRPMLFWRPLTKLSTGLRLR